MSRSPSPSQSQTGRFYEAAEEDGVLGIVLAEADGPSVAVVEAVLRGGEGIAVGGDQVLPGPGAGLLIVFGTVARRALSMAFIPKGPDDPRFVADQHVLPAVAVPVADPCAVQWQKRGSM